MDLPNRALATPTIRNIKLITGNDTITIEYENGELETYRGSCTFLFATNHALTLRGCDLGFEERVVCIPFTYTIPPKQRNPFLLNLLLSERDNIFCMKAECRGNRRLSHGYGTDFLPDSQQFRTGLFVDTGIGTQTHHRPGICRVDNGIHTHIGNIVSDNLKGHMLTAFSFLNISITYLQTVRKLFCFLFLRQNMDACSENCSAAAAA